MSKGYEVPSWGALPTENFNLEVLKNGIVVDNIILEKQDHFVFGRQPDVCDVTLDHPSISRVHAILQYRDDGALMILDMSSAHGTVVNKTPLTQGVYQRLYVGDFVKFGASSRSYVVGGPSNQMLEEYDSTNMKIYRQKLVERTEKVQAAQKEEEDTGVAWGFGEDAVNYEEEDEDQVEEEELPDYVKNDPNYKRIYGEKFSSTLKASEMNEKDAAVLEKIRKKEKKIQNMQEEIKRIYMKEGKQDEGLTSGQAAAVERNDKRIEVLKAEVEAMENSLREKNMQREGTSGKKSGANDQKNDGSSSTKSMRSRQESDNYDDALDMTAETADVATNWRLRKKLKQKGLLNSDGTSVSGGSGIGGRGTALTYEMLCKQRDEHQTALDNVLSRLTAVDAVLNPSSRDANSDQMVADGDGDDGLDAYLNKSKQEEAMQARKGLEQEQIRLSRELSRVERLVKIAAPDISSLSMVRKIPSNIPDRGDTMPAVVRTGKPDGASESQSSSNGERKEEMSGEALSVVGAADEATDKVPGESQALKPKQSVKVSHNPSMVGVGSLVSSIEWSKPGDEEEDDEVNDGDGEVPPKDEKLTEKRVRGDRGSGSSRKKQRVDSNSSDKLEANTAAIASSRGPVVKGPQRPSSVTKAVETGTLGGDYLEGGDKIWAPPTNQTGDGKTALNAKYGY